MHVLVVGGNGFIGSHVVDSLRAEKAEVSVLDRSPETYRPPLTGVRYYQGSIGNSDDVEAALKDKPDVVIHLANYGLSFNATGVPESDLRNLNDSVILFESCIKHQVSKIIFTSTGGKIYGINGSAPVKESAATNPLGSYAITKLAIEKHLLSLSHYYGTTSVILRPSNPYGVRQSPLGQQGAIPIFGWKLLHHEPITIWGKGDAVRDYIDVKDLARFYSLAALRECSGIFNLGSGVGVSTVDLVDHLSDVLKVSPIIQWEPAREFDVPRIVLDISRAKQQFDWKPQTDLRAGVVEVTDWLRELSLK